MAESISPTAPTLLLEPQPAPGGRAPGAVLPRVTIDATALEFLNFAQVHNSVPLVRELAITNTGEGALLGLVVRVELEPFMEPWQGTISRLAPGATHHLDDLPLVFRDELLINATERDHGVLRIRVTEEGEGRLIAERSSPVAVLAYNEWRRDTEPEMLASFVLPNHPDVGKVVDLARQLVGEATGDPALDGYQSKDPGRARAMARAVYGALGKLGITYANPPASFEETGQKIRTPEQILADGVATCLDVSVLVAAALEQMGLHPLITLVQGHAFPGVWLQEDYRKDGGFWDAASLRNDLELGVVEVFDSSPAVQSPPSPYERAVASARHQLQDDEAHRFTLDVRGARGRRYRPLPARVHGQEYQGIREILVHSPALAPPAPAPAAPLPAQLPATAAEAQEEDPPEVQEAKTRLRFWQRQLLDLTLRNRLLNYYPDGRHGLRLQCPSLDRLEDLLASGSSFLLHPESFVFSPGDSRSAPIRRAQTGTDVDREFLEEHLEQGVLFSDQSPEAHVKQLVLLDRKGRESFEEGGAHTIYLALGLLRWFEAPSSELARFAPLLLVPVRLRRGTARDPWSLEPSDEAPVFNPSLIQKLQAEFGLDLSAFAEELPGDDAGLDVRQVFTTVRSVIRGLARWELLEEAHLAHFSFTKLMMWRDLELLRTEVVASPLLRALARKGRERFPSQGGVPQEQELDARFAPADLFCPLDADSSQLAAVLGAAHGESFVLQGPPGTGKSQTITNLITHCLASGKTVLFVSAKMAALEVVHRRLERVGMGPFCLELHSHSANKKAVLEQLSQALHAAGETPAEWRPTAARLAGVRAQLNGYVEALHRPRSQGATLREGMATLCQLRDAPRSVALDLGDPRALSREDLQERRARLRSVVTLARRLGPPREHGLWGARLTSWTPAVQDDVARNLDAARAALLRLEEASSSLSKELGFDVGATCLDDLEALGGVAALLEGEPALHAGLLESSRPREQREELLACLDLGADRDELRQRLERDYTEDLYRLDLTQLAQKLRVWGTAFFLVAFFMLWSVRRILRSTRRGGPLPRNDVLLADVEGARRVGELEERMRAVPGEIRSSLMTTTGTPRAPWKELREQIERSWELRRALDALSARPRLVSAAQGLTARLAAEATAGRAHAPLAAGRELQGALAATQAALSAVAQRLQLDVELRWGGPRVTLPELSHSLGRLSAAQGELRDWSHYQELRQELATRPEGPLLDALERGEITPDQLEPAFRRAYEQAWVTHEYEGEPLLRSFDGAVHEATIDAFRDADRTFCELAAAQARSVLVGAIPRGGEGEMAVLHRELRKQRRHLPIRRLFAEIPNVRRRLKPCLLMSPLSVAQYLSPSERFDVVVFDEASQLPTADAIGAVARGRQLIVVGDSKQLPPTTFFSQSLDDDAGEDEHAADEVESILDECMASQLQELPLRWHYRSQHEHLIAFSNHYYYDDRLFTFAAADDRGRRLGLHFVPVPHGHYDKGRSRTNRAEAEALVAEVVRRLRDPEESRRSLGVVTFSVAQQTLVQDLLELERARHPDLERFFGDGVVEPVFVKNLENVQGDERDVILFSICYGPDAQGRVSMNFGPLNKEGGERRLNVAVTRARQQLVVFSTLRADQIDLRRTRAVGVKHLRRFLEYAARGPAAIAEAIEVGDAPRFDSPFEEEVYRALRARGHELVTQVGCSGYRIDLAVVDPEAPGRFLLGIECDGAAYHSARTARDRDRLRADVLRSLGWRLHRVWSTDWWTQPERVLADVERAITEAAAAGPLASLPGANAASPAPPSEAAAAPRRSEDPGNITPPPLPVQELGEEYVVARLPEGPVPYDLEDLGAQSLLAADVQRVVEAEAPVHLRLIGVRLSSRWGITRLTQRVLRAIENVVRARRLGVVRGEIVWRADQDPATYTTVRRPGQDPDSERRVEDLPPEELLAAARQLLERNLSIREEEFQRAVARAFGYRRSGARVAERAQEAIETLIAVSIAERQDGFVVLAKRS